ncbi:hypothetical protein ACNJUT_20800, partial [Mycobacterium tuberculosis]
MAALAIGLLLPWTLTETAMAQSCSAALIDFRSRHGVALHFEGPADQALEILAELRSIHTGPCAAEQGAEFRVAQVDRAIAAVRQEQAASGPRVHITMGRDLGQRPAPAFVPPPVTQPPTSSVPNPTSTAHIAPPKAASVPVTALPPRPAAGSGLPPLLRGETGRVIPAQAALRSKVIAGNGRSAMGCVSLEVVTKRDSSSTAIGGRRLVNRCGEKVEISWCYVDTECAQDHGSSWTLDASGVASSWPISAEREVRWAACMGPNSGGLTDHGTRFICYAPGDNGRQPLADPADANRASGRAGPGEASGPQTVRPSAPITDPAFASSAANAISPNGS